MKTIFLFLCFLGPVVLAAQTIDSSAIKQVDSLVLVSRTLTGQGDFNKALEVNAAAEAIALEKCGRISAAYGKTCFNHGRVLDVSKNLEESEKWYLESIDIREKTLGKEHLDYAGSLSNLGSVYHRLGNDEKAETLLLEALKIYEKSQGKAPADYAWKLYNLAGFYMDVGQYKKSESRFLEVIALNIAQSNSLLYSYTVFNLASLYLKMSNYEKAESFFLEAKDLFEKANGKGSPDYAVVPYNLGLVYYYMGDYERAESLQLEAKNIWGNPGGEAHPYYPNSLNSMAMLYEVMGNYEKAEPLYLETITIRGKKLGKDHADYAASLNNLAILYYHMGKPEKAEPLYLAAKAILEKPPTGEHAAHAGSLINLGIFYLDLNRNQEAETLLLEAKAIFEEKLQDRNDPFYMNSLSGLAKLYQKTGNYKKAEAFFLQAKDLREKQLGKEHIDFEVSLAHLAVLYEKQLRFSESEPFFAEWSDLEQSRLLRLRVFLSEKELASYTLAYQRGWNTLGACLLARHGTEGRTLPALAFDRVLFYKGFLLDAAARLRKLADVSPEAKEIDSRLKVARRRLAAEYAKPPAERNDVAALEDVAASTEKELARAVNSYAEAGRQLHWQAVQAALPTGSAAIEFVHFQVNFPEKTDSVMYVALLLLPGADQPQFIPLFEAKQLEALLNVIDKRKADWVNQLYKEAGNGQPSLYELLWQPMEQALVGVQTIYFSPSGQLHRLNLGAIVMPPSIRGQSETSTIGERFRLIELGSTRQLVISSGMSVADSSNDAPEISGQALLFGGIQYEIDSTAMASVNPGLENTPAISRNRGLDFSNSDATLRSGRWQYLPWTKVEVTALDGILTGAGIQTTTRKAYAATEEAFKKIGEHQPSPRILHLATHGFFFPDPKITVDNGSRSVPGTLDREESAFKISEHPMIRSGLLLAGANYAWEKGKPYKPDQEDGVLTAYEISQMDLSHTEVVVLSACETGLGDIQGNEGVYGLQRAFKIAGVKYLVMSLWQVPDFQTQQLMSAFYRHWLQDKMSIPDAFRSAQRAMQEKFRDPFFWAGFVLVE